MAKARRKSSAFLRKAKPSKAKSSKDNVVSVLRAKINSDFAQRHPATARRERSFRVAAVKQREAFDHKNEGTVETHAHASKTREGAVQRLYQSGALSGEQFDAALSIRAVVQRIGADTTVRTASLETRVDGSSSSADERFFETLSQVRREIAYSAWRGQFVTDRIFEAIMAVIVQDEGVTLVARSHRIDVRRLRKAIIDALDLWPSHYADARGQVDAASLAAAQAGLMS